MQFFLYSDETKIGEVHFRGSDPPMGCAQFHLLPNEYYLALQPELQSETMRLLEPSNSLKATYDVASLALTIRDGAGGVVAARGVAVTDGQASLRDEPIEVWLVGVDEFERYAASFG